MIKNKYQITYVLDLRPNNICFRSESGLSRINRLWNAIRLSWLPHFWFTSIVFSRFKSPGCLFVNHQNHRNF